MESFITGIILCSLMFYIVTRVRKPKEDEIWVSDFILYPKECYFRGVVKIICIKDDIVYYESVAENYNEYMHIDQFIKKFRKLVS